MLNLKEIRESKGYTQEKLAEEVGVIRQTISNIECGLSLPSVQTAKIIARILEFDWKDFFEDESGV